MEETLTLLALGIKGALYRTLRSTNPIENLNGSVANYTKNMKRWRGGGMRRRWVGAAVVEAPKGFRKIRGHRNLKELVQALQQHELQQHELQQRVQIEDEAAKNRCLGAANSRSSTASGAIPMFTIAFLPL